jgi:hypothetical protein
LRCALRLLRRLTAHRLKLSGVGRHAALTGLGWRLGLTATDLSVALKLGQQGFLARLQSVLRALELLQLLLLLAPLKAVSVAFR